VAVTTVAAGPSVPPALAVTLYALACRRAKSRVTETRSCNRADYRKVLIGAALRVSARSPCGRRRSTSTRSASPAQWGWFDSLKSWRTRRDLAALEGLLPARRASQAVQGALISGGPEQPLGGTANKPPPSPGHKESRPETCEDERRAAPRSAIDRREPLGLRFAYA
jgi:hypothetical protein